MTRKEAIARIKDHIVVHKMDEPRAIFISEALNMAIKALEQEPCEDCVSRNAIIKSLNEMDRYIAKELTLCDSDNRFSQNEVFIVDDVYEQILEQLPSVTPKPKTGKGIDYSDEGYVECPFCGHATNCEDNIDELHYCFYCGAKMESEE